MIWIPVVAAALLPHAIQDREVASPEPEPQGMMSGYLKIPPIKGESERSAQGNGPIFARGNAEGAASADKDHENWIDLQSVTFMTAGEVQAQATGHRQHRPVRIVKRVDPATPQAAGTSGTSRSRGSTTLGDVVIVRQMDKSTPLLIVTGAFAACEVGEKIDAMEVGSGDEAYMVRGATVVDCGEPQATSGDADDRPTEEVAFYYNKITFSYARKDMVLKGKKILQN